MADDCPGATSYLDRHGKRRWRFRHGRRSVALPGAPGEPAFAAAYEAALAGRPRARATVSRLPTAAAPRSLAAAWRILINNTPAWKELDPETRASQTRIAERFLRSPVDNDPCKTYGELPLAELRRRHVKAILAARAATPHAAAHLLRLIRKLTGVALDQEWIETDPTYRLSYRPPYRGWKAWPAETRERYEAHWPLGSNARTAYALALYLGHRRSDIARVRWDYIDAVESSITQIQRKTGKRLVLLMLQPLLDALAAVPRRGDTVLITRYGQPFSARALGMRMQGWTRAAGLPPGHTLHGLRKTLGKMLAEHGATTREIMAVLGHDDIAHAELYTREAEQRLLATSGLRKLAGNFLAVIDGDKGDG